MEYQVAVETHNVAIRKYQAKVADYRSMKIGDAEFLKAKAVYDAATKDFDVAFAIAQEA